MKKTSRWREYTIVTVINLILLLLTYFSLVNLPAPTINVLPTQSFDSSAPTATLIPLVSVAIALQNLPRGYHFPNTIQELENIVGYAMWPENIVPSNAITQNKGKLEILLGKVITVDIYRELPILSTQLVTDLTQLESYGSDLAALLPKGRVATTIRFPYEAIPTGLAVGDHVNVFYSDNKNDGSQRKIGVTNLVASDVSVVWIGEIQLGSRIMLFSTPTYDRDLSDTTNVTVNPSIISNTSIPIVLAVTNQESVNIIWAQQHQMQLSLVIRSARDTSPVVITPIGLP